MPAHQSTFCPRSSLHHCQGVSLHSTAQPSSCTMGRIHMHRGQDPHAPWAGSTGQNPHAPWAGSTCTMGRIHMHHGQDPHVGRIHWARSTCTVGRIHMHRGQDPLGKIHMHRGQDPHAPWAGSTCTVGKIHWANPHAPWAGSACTMGRIHWARSTCTVGTIHMHRGQDPNAPWTGSTLSSLSMKRHEDDHFLYIPTGLGGQGTMHSTIKGTLQEGHLHFMISKQWGVLAVSK